MKDTILATVRYILGNLMIGAVVLGLVWLANRWVPLLAVQRFFETRPTLTTILAALAIATSILGILALALAQLLPAPRQQSSSQAPAPLPQMEYAEAHGHLSSSFSGSTTPQDTRQAWRLRAWRYSKEWRVLFVMMAGAVLLLTGLLALGFVLGPPILKLLSAAVWLFLAGAAAWVFRNKAGEP